MEINIEERLTEVYNALYGADIEGISPLPGIKKFMPMIGMFLPKAAEALKTEEGQANLLKLIALFAWVIGYQTSFEKEDSIGCDGITRI